MADTTSHLFDQISPRYDFLNHLLSFGIDFYWRKKVAELACVKKHLSVLDAATGTGDQLLAILKKAEGIKKAVGIDLSSEMLREAERKIAKTSHSRQVKLERADLCALPFKNQSFDVATLSFGIRNMNPIPKALGELYRVIKKEGKALILEFSLPSHFLVRPAYLFYLRHMLPPIGGFLTKNKEAYLHLSRSIQEFPSAQGFCKLIRAAGFTSVKAHPMTCGIVTLYEAKK